MNLWDNSRAIGKRAPYYVKYEAGFDDDGKLQGIKFDIYVSSGVQKNDSPLDEIQKWIDSSKFRNVQSDSCKLTRLCELAV